MEDKYRMDSHKLLWHLDRVNAWHKGERIVPLHIDLGITTGCNMRCTYCYGVIQGQTEPGKRFDMPKDALVRLLKDAKAVGVKSIAFIGEGENTLNEALYDGLNCVRKIGLDASLATNNLLIKKEKINDMLTALTWIRINISAANPDAFFRIHGINQFERVINNTKTLVEAKKKYSFETTIGLQMVVTKDNINEIVPLAKLGKELGVDYTVIKSCSDTYEKRLDSPVEKYREISEIFKEAQSYGDSEYLVSVKWKKLENLGLKDFKVCYGTQFIIAISGDGSVFPCGHFFNIRRDEFNMGNIIQTRFKDLVFSEKYWEVQKKMQALDVNKECESNCRQYYISQFLWKLKNPPIHVNFV